MNKKAPPPLPQYKYEILIDSLDVFMSTVKKDQTLGEILFSNKSSYQKINTIIRKSKGIFDVRKVNYGYDYASDEY